MDWDAERYHRVSEPQLAWGRGVLRRLAPVAGERVLDLGCGSGRLTREMLEAMGEGLVVGLDRSASMLAEAVRRAREQPPITALHEVARPGGRIVFVRGDGADLPFVDAFDAVFSNAALHWMPDHDAVFASVYRALAPGGRFVAQCGGEGNLARLHARAGAVMRKPEWAGAFDGWQEAASYRGVPETLIRLERAGFTVLEVSLAGAPAPFASRAAYEEFVACVCLRPHLARLAPERRPAFVAAIADQAGRDEDPFILDYVRLNISARKPAVTEQAA